MEIRVKVEEYVNQKILALRQNHPGSYDNVSILRMNAMKFLPNFFEKHQVGIQGNGFRTIWIVGDLETALANRIYFNRARMIVVKDVLLVPRPSLQEKKAQGPYHYVCSLES